MPTSGFELGSLAVLNLPRMLAGWRPYVVSANTPRRFISRDPRELRPQVGLTRVEIGAHPA